MTHYSQTLLPATGCASLSFSPWLKNGVVMERRHKQVPEIKRSSGVLVIKITKREVMTNMIACFMCGWKGKLANEGLSRSLSIIFRALDQQVSNFRQQSVSASAALHPPRTQSSCWDTSSSASLVLYTVASCGNNSHTHSAVHKCMCNLLHDPTRNQLITWLAVWVEVNKTSPDSKLKVAQWHGWKHQLLFILRNAEIFAFDVRLCKLWRAQFPPQELYPETRNWVHFHHIDTGLNSLLGNCKPFSTAGCF